VRASAGKADFFWFLLLLAFIAVGVVAAAGLALVAEFDKAAATREQILVANGIAGRVNEVAHSTLSEIVWDDAVRYLDNRFDIDWARANIGTYFRQNDGFEDSFILDPDDRPVFAADSAGETDIGFYRRFDGSMKSLVAAVRATESRRGAVRLAARARQFITEPIQASTVANANGGVYILSATLVEPDFGTALPKATRAPIVVTAMRVDQAFINSFSHRYLLADLRLAATGWRRTGHAASVTLRNDLGAEVATLVWEPQRPGQAMLARLGWPVMGLLLALATGILLLYRRARRFAEKLMTSEARATHLAYHDALTGLPNRVLFFDRLAHALSQMRRRGESLAIFCLDLDRFKDINDTYGHPTGDELIKKVGRIMASQCRGADTVARLSGDEFAIIQTNASAGAAAALAARLNEVLTNPIELEVGRVFIGCSIGITIVNDPDLQPAEILRQADLALYRTKETMKGQFCFFELEMDAAIKTRHALEEDLRAALAEGGLHVAYQPQVNTRGGVTGVEALLRWRHPQRGDVSPGFFVPIAEECGLIVDLGMFALRQAFLDSKRWKHLKIAINISPKQLRMKDFVARIMALVDELDVDPRQFELEITEGILLGDDPDTHAMLCTLREHGFDLALDDFGTGYSSLSYLQRYPISRIKIDRSFIANLGDSSESEEFIAAIVRLARALRLSVIAEGVETTSQHDCLSSAGCTDMQGFLFSKAVTADEIEALCHAPLRKRRAAEPTESSAPDGNREGPPAVVTSARDGGTGGMHAGTHI
jgi:diguanylate cyclase (GGDEF)-like protein